MKWTKAKRLAKERREMKRFDKYRQTLEFQLCEALQGSAGERGYEESPVDCLYRIKSERDQALLILGLDRLKHFREGRL